MIVRVCGGGCARMKHSSWFNSTDICGSIYDFPRLSHSASGTKSMNDRNNKNNNNRGVSPRKIAETNHETEAKQCDLCVPFIIYQFSRYGDGNVSRSSAFASQYIVVVDCVGRTNGSGGSAKSFGKLFSVPPRVTYPILKWILQSSLSRINPPLIRSVQCMRCTIVLVWPKRGIRAQCAADGI